MRWYGLFGYSGHDHHLDYVRCDLHTDLPPCGLCAKILQSLPPDYLLEFEPFLEVSYSETAVLREAAKRGANLGEALERAMQEVNGLPIHPCDGENAFAAKWSRHAYRRIHNLVEAGADPTRQRLADVIRLRQRCSGCTPSLGWCRVCDRMSNSGALHNLGFPEGPDGQRLVLKEHFDALRKLGVPLRNTDVKIVSITHAEMVPVCNRGHDWLRYGDISESESEDEEGEAEDGSEDGDEDEDEDGDLDDIST